MWPSCHRFLYLNERDETHLESHGLGWMCSGSDAPGHSGHSFLLPPSGTPSASASERPATPSVAPGAADVGVHHGIPWSVWQPRLGWSDDANANDRPRPSPFRSPFRSPSRYPELRMDFQEHRKDFWFSRRPFLGERTRSRTPKWMENTEVDRHRHWYRFSGCFYLVVPPNEPWKHLGVRLLVRFKPSSAVHFSKPGCESKPTPNQR